MTAPARPLVALACTVLALAGSAGCAIPPTRPSAAGEVPRTAADGVQLYLVRDGELFPTVRQVGDPQSPRDPVKAVAVLTNGPTRAETAAGLRSALPAGLEAFPLQRHSVVRGETALDVYVIGDPRLLRVLATEQIACTVIAASVLADDPVRVVMFRDKRGRQRGPVRCPVPTAPGAKRVR